jgi:hypothetical protein
MRQRQEVTARYNGGENVSAERKNIMAKTDSALIFHHYQECVH